ncbi:MAG: hypothetical protein ABI554_09970 [Flavobacterium sp.]
MKEYINNINWAEFWEFSKQFILPNIGWFVFWAVLFIILGIILGIIFNVFLYKKNIFSRDRKYYNWIAKLWIPYLMIVFIYFSTMIGLIYGGYNILCKENQNITASIYAKTLGNTFASEKEKKDFLHTLQRLSNSSEDISKTLTKAIALSIKQNNTGLTAVDKIKDSSTSYLLQQYESEVYSAVVYGLMKVVDDKAGVKNAENIDYEKFKLLLKKLDTIEPQKIETAIQSEIAYKSQSLLKYIYKEIVKHELFFFGIFLLFPFIEYLIYLKFIKKTESSLTPQ